ncbi:sulfite exporter TauE/SafE family protein [Syntrophobacteraceae bacterium DRH4]|nr:sulfite exporter TauE/SafE family protein [Desulfoferrobacter suflitae]MCK8601873.1 sulfite exporter TauE/SafE family protein [Desulfoferrobacter suflitae]
MNWVDFLYVTFPLSGVKTWVFLPPLVAFIVSFFTSMGGISGAFLLLPFQVSVLHYTSPSVSGTNQVFNVVAIPSGVYRYIKERRMVWPLTWAVIIGTLPGVFIGAWVRIMYLPDPKDFKLFAGLVLLYIGARLAWDTLKSKGAGALAGKGAGPAGSGGIWVSDTKFSLHRVEYKFAGETYSFSPAWVFLMTFVVGIVGGIYGIGGGAIVAPFFVAIFKMPVYTVAGAALMGTFITSVAGVLFYQLLDLYLNTSMSVGPDWVLGALFGVGGFCGMYLGARCQKYVPGRVIKLILCVCILFVAVRYVIGFFA